MEREVNRETIQQEAIDACLTSLEVCSKAAIVASVGIGKGRISLEVISKINPSSILWLTNSEELRDNDAPSEFSKWGYDYLLEITEFTCYQTAYKWENKHWDLVVADELDYSLTDEYLKFYKNNTYGKLIGVTGTITEEKRWVLEELGIPIVYEITNQESQDLGILNKVFYKFIEYDLSSVKNRVKKTKTKQWMTSEEEEYNYIESSYMKVLLPYLSINKTMSDYFNRGIPFPEGKTYNILKAEKIKLKKSMDWFNAQRYRFLQSLDTSVTITKKILSNHYHGNTVDKVIVFSGLTDQIERICKYTYHSKNKKDNTSIDDFNSGKLRVLGVCSALDRGKNMKGLNVGIFESFDSSSTKLGQRLGRLNRLLSSDTATVYFLLPYYKKKVWNKETSRYELRRTPTRSVGWLEKALINYRIDETNSITIKHTEI